MMGLSQLNTQCMTSLMDEKYQSLMCRLLCQMKHTVSMAASSRATTPSTTVNGTFPQETIITDLDYSAERLELPRVDKREERASNSSIPACKSSFEVRSTPA